MATVAVLRQLNELPHGVCAFHVYPVILTPIHAPHLTAARKYVMPLVEVSRRVRFVEVREVFTELLQTFLYRKILHSLVTGILESLTQCLPMCETVIYTGDVARL